MTTQAPKRRLTCNCCGEGAGRFVQHWNRDTGWGICRNCLNRHYIGKGHDAAEIRSLFGEEGINYATQAQWDEMVKREREEYLHWRKENGLPDLEGGAL